MRSTLGLFALGVGVLALVMAPGIGWAQPVSGTVSAGADVRSVCTLAEVPLAGYGGIDRRKGFPWPDGYTFFFNPSQGEADPVRVKSMVIEVQSSPPQKIAFVGLDAIGISENIITAVVAQLGGTGLVRENIVFMATHTHSGPGAVSDKIFWQIAAVDILNQTVFDHVVQNIVDSILAANAALQPARLGIGVGSQNAITENRRSAGGPFDPRVGVIKVEASPSGAPIGVVFNFSVHGTCLGGSNMLYSADNMGYAERYLEIAYPGIVPIFSNAAEGDVKPISGGFAGAQLVGESLAMEVEAVWNQTTADENVTLEIQTQMVQLPPLDINVAACDSTLQSLLGTWLFNLPGDIAETQELFMAVRLNDYAVVTVPGEPITQLGWDIEATVEAQGFTDVFIFGLTNGYMGYVVTPSEYDLGGYEACGTLHGRLTGDFVYDTSTAVGLALTPPGQTSVDGGVGGDAGSGNDGGTTFVDAAPRDGAPGSDAAPTDAASTGDAAGPGADAGDGEANNAGCGCRGAGDGSSSLPGFLLLLALVVRSRRRR